MDTADPCEGDLKIAFTRGLRHKPVRPSANFDAELQFYPVRLRLFDLVKNGLRSLNSRADRLANPAKDLIRASRAETLTGVSLGRPRARGRQPGCDGLRGEQRVPSPAPPKSIRTPR
jgi:hypothetical protein